MILGIDHVALSCSALEPAVTILEKTGFRMTFREPALPNAVEKTPFLARQAPLHGIAHGRGAVGIGIELTAHELPVFNAPPAGCSGAGPYEVLLGGGEMGMQCAEISPASCHRVIAEAWAAGLQVEAFPCDWSPFQTRIWRARTTLPQHNIGILGLMLPTRNLAAAESFWTRGMGGAVAGHGTLETRQAWKRVRFRSPVAAWAGDLILVEANLPAAAHYLDVPGFTCLALWSNNIGVDVDRLESAGGAARTPVFALRVHDRTLNICLMRGPDNEPVELIEAVRPAKNA